MSAPRPVTLLNRIEAAGFRLARGFLRLFPPKRRSAIAGWAGRVIGARLPFTARAETALKELRPQLDATGRKRLIAAMMDNFTRTAVEYEHLPDLYADAPNWTVEGVEHLTAAQEGGRGYVLASAHFGNWEAVRAAAALHGAPMAIIYRAFNNRLIDEAWYEFIVSGGSPAFRKGSEGARGLFKHVRKGGGAMILVDQRQGGGPLLDFLGRPAETSTSAAQLARTLRAPLLTARAIRTADGFSVRFEPEIPRGAPDQMTQVVNDRIAGWVEEAPEQWFWLHRRWKIRSKGSRKRKFDSAAEAAEGEQKGDAPSEIRAAGD